MPSTAIAEQFAGAMRTVRTATEPAPGDIDAVQVTCPECGNPYWRWKGKPRQRCGSCAEVRSIANTVSMAAKEGPAYEKAVRKQLAFWTAEARRLGLSADDEPPAHNQNR